MNRYRRIIVFTLLAIVVAILWGSSTPASAWPGDKHVTVKINGETSYWFIPGAVDCRSATLSYPGKQIGGSIQNSWLPAKCTATFSSVPVNTWVTITMKVCVRGSCVLSSPKTRTASRYTGNPPLIGNTKTLESMSID
jgi:hypothetical protein